MQYYYIKNSTEGKVIGRKWPQCSAYPHELGYNWSYAELPNSMTKIPHDKFSEIKPFIIFGLENSSKLTDVLSNATIHADGLLISERTKILFDENLTIPNSKYYEAYIYCKGKMYKYYFLHILQSKLNVIDFDNSEFGLYKYFLSIKFLKDLTFKNFIELEEYYKNFMNRTEIIKFKIIILKITGLDIFRFNILCRHSEFIVSEKIIQIIKEHKLTGFEIIPIE